MCVEEEGPWSGEGGGGPGGGVRAPVREKELRPSPLSGGGGQVGVPDPAAADGAAADGQAQVRAGGGGRVVHELLLNELRTPIAGVCVWWGRGTRGLEDRREAAQELLFAAQAAQEPLLDDLPWRRGRRGRGTAGGGGEDRRHAAWSQRCGPSACLHEGRTAATPAPPRQWRIAAAPFRKSASVICGGPLAAFAKRCFSRSPLQGGAEDGTRHSSQALGALRIPMHARLVGKCWESLGGCLVTFPCAGIKLGFVAGACEPHGQPHILEARPPRLAKARLESQSDSH